MMAQYHVSVRQWVFHTQLRVEVMEVKAVHTSSEKVVAIAAATVAMKITPQVLEQHKLHVRVVAAICSLVQAIAAVYR